MTTTIRGYFLLALATPGLALATPLRVRTSEALDPAMHKWAEACAAAIPGMEFDLGGKEPGASAAALTQMLEGKVDVVFAGRPLREGEAIAFANKFHGPPVLFAVATPAPYGKENRSALGVLV